MVNAITGDTIKRCRPFVDAMTNGFLIPLICDVRVENGEFARDNELPPGGEVNYVRSPIGFHDASRSASRGCCMRSAMTAFDSI